MWLNDIIKEAEAFLSSFPLCQLQFTTVVFLARQLWQIPVSYAGTTIPIAFLWSKTFPQSPEETSKFHWPRLNYMPMTYHKEGWESEYLYFSLFIRRPTIIARKQRYYWAKNNSAWQSIETCKLPVHVIRMQMLWMRNSGQNNWIILSNGLNLALIIVKPALGI